MQKWTEIGAFRHCCKKLSRYTKPVLFRGTVKLHGSNLGVSYHRGIITTQSRSTILSDDADNYGFHKWFTSEILNNPLLNDQLVSLFKTFIVDEDDRITLYGEYCGPKVQKKVAISQLPSKQWFLFGIKRNDETLLFNQTINIDHPQIHNILDFPTFMLQIDPMATSTAIVTITELTLAVENECPVSKQLGLPSGIGEGIVWSAIDYPSDTDLVFKSKGEKHNSSNETTTKIIASIDPIKLKLVEDVVEYILPEGRLRQGFEHINSREVEQLGVYLKWICNDILKEESDTLQSNNLEWKDVNKLVTSKAKSFFTQVINSEIEI